VNDDLTSVERTAEIVKDADAVISAYAPPPENTDQLIPVTKLLADATAQGGAKRLLMVGGAGGLEVAPGVTLLGSGHLPKEWVPIASSHVRAFELLRSSAIDWTYVAPAAFFEPGIRTGSYRLGTDNLVVNDQGNSRVSMEDYAIAMVDELENPRHRRQRFSVGY
jgi:putative NADH-flavin reductase